MAAHTARRGACFAVGRGRARVPVNPVSGRVCALGLQTYFTGRQEVRAWTVHAGSTAPQAAGVIHTDFEHGSSRRGHRYETSSPTRRGGGEGAGKLRLEGKEYIVREGM